MQTLLCKMGHFCQFVVYFRQFVAYIHKKSGSPHIGLPLIIKLLYLRNQSLESLSAKRLGLCLVSHITSINTVSSTT